MFTRGAALAGLMVLVGCGSDSNRVTDPADDGNSGASVPATPDAPTGAAHRGVQDGDLLRWNAPTNADDAQVVGYNVYAQDPAMGSTFLKQNTALVTNGRLVLSTLTRGETIWFAVAAVNTEDEEGGWSEPVSFVAVGALGEDPRGGLQEHDGSGIDPSQGSGDGGYQP